MFLVLHGSLITQGNSIEISFVLRHFLPDLGNADMFVDIYSN